VVLKRGPALSSGFTGSMISAQLSITASMPRETDSRGELMAVRASIKQHRNRGEEPLALSSATQSYAMKQ
jgi:hypothetical protein